ncbi:MAG: chromate efflux transporter [Betaproteobacteria bacterium]
MNHHSARSQLVEDDLLSIFVIFLKLGCTSFGGPIAHLGYLRTAFVERRKWVDDQAYADIVALCQFLPGPASSQVGIALGLSRRGLLGGIAAWLGFTLPSAIIMIACAYGVRLLDGPGEPGWLHGLKIAAVAVVAQAVWNMGRQLCPDLVRRSIAVAAALVLLIWPGGVGQIGVIVASAVIGWCLLPVDATPRAPETLSLSRRRAWITWVLFIGLLMTLPIVARSSSSYALALFDSFYRSGALVFGGGHVVLPLLHEAVVPRGWISESDFLAGYGMAQALPGPLFSFAAYLGAASHEFPNGWIGGIIALIAIFLPGFLLVVGALPYWDEWRKRTAIRAAMNGVNAAVVGILLAALYDPIFVSAVHTRSDFALALLATAMLVLLRASPLWIVGGTALAGVLLGLPR